MRNTSVLFCLIGLMFLMTGFVGFMAYTFASSTSELNGIRLMKPEDLDKKLEAGSTACFLSQVFADDFIEMPDSHQKVVKGSIRLYALWPDGSKSIIQNWSKEARFLRIKDSESLPGAAIVPQEVECARDTAGAGQRLRVSRSQNSATIEYYGIKSTLSGCYSKGQPQIVLEREVLENGAKAAVIVSRPDGPSGSPAPLCVQKVVPYEKALLQDGRMSAAKTAFLVIGLAGALMFFVPENKAINTLATKVMSGGLLPRQK